MATYHMSLKKGGRGKALPHADYIGRMGKYSKRPEADHLTAQGAGNLPSWANGSTRAFWEAADRFERANGVAYREIELALPRELTPEQNIALVQSLIADLVGPKPYQYAIHTPAAALEGGPQPHLHLMFSDRVPDGLDRPAEMHFRRYNACDPDLGGCRKDSGGKNKDTVTRELIALRKTCADTLNHHLALHRHKARVDYRSHADRGITVEAGRHLGPARARIFKQSTENRGVETIAAPHLQ